MFMLLMDLVSAGSSFKLCVIGSCWGMQCVLCNDAEESHIVDAMYTVLKHAVRVVSGGGNVSWMCGGA
jgi:hypothetical protein